MTSDPLTGAGRTNGVDQSGATPVPARDPQREQVRKLAQEFEAMLLTQMLREMRQSMLSDDEEDVGGGLGRDTMTDTIDVELGRALSSVGGFGLSSVMLQAIERGVGLGKASAAAAGSIPTGQLGPLQVSPVRTIQAPPTGPAPVAVDPAASVPEASAPVVPVENEGALKVPEGHVTSAYGWRRDPFTGAPRFHKGIDVAQAYGHEVPAAGAGRVVFAGDRGTYGTMVILEHPSGRQTRYAHLMAAEVKVGDEVGAGQVIGKSGDSGRSTGPHLHFEVVEAGGQAIDPAHH